MSVLRSVSKWFRGRGRPTAPVRKPARARLGLESLDARIVPSTFHVENLAPGSLRAAVTQANVHPGADDVVFDSGLAGTIVTYSPHEETVVNTALKTRNFLIHHYFWERAEDFMAQQGRERMLKELWEWVALFEEATKIALRLEQAAAEAANIPWNKVIEYARERVEKALAADKRELG